MKTNTIKYLFFLGFFFFLVACSVKKNNFVSRNSHALSTKYNILYNGGIALDKGIVDLKSQYHDNFWERLPVERMQVSEDKLLPGENKNANFDRAETKSIKAIQKHSMNIKGSEKNPQMDEAHLMLGQARYYDQRFVPALEAFNYVLYKYPKSDKIYEVKIWREKTNMRLDNDALAVNNLRKLLKEIDFKDQIFADANATLAQAFLNLEEKDSAVSKLKIATEFTKFNEEKARYRFILAQLYEELKYKDSAYVMYQNVIDMNRKSARQYVIQAHAKQAQYFDAEKGDTIAFLKKFRDLLEDRENRPFLDVLHHQMALFYGKQKNFDQAKKHYNVSLKKKTADTYLIASNYRNLADIYFNSAKYLMAEKYFDSTLVHLQPRTREFNLITKKRENLEDVIKYESIAQLNDSIISVFNMSETEKVSYYDKYIEKLKKEDKAKLALAEKQARIAENAGGNGDGGNPNDVQGVDNPSGKTNTPPTSNPGSSGKPSSFYFYNSATVALGKVEFKKNWGNRTLQDNWRVASLTNNKTSKEDDDTASNEDEKNEKEAAKTEEKYSADFYISQLPKSQTVIDSLSKERNFAYYQLGVIYKEKFKEYQLAANKLEQLLKNKPEERLILPSMYNLYKIYEILDDKGKAEAMKAQIISQYPDSRYAQILSSGTTTANSSDSPEAIYEKLYKEYENGEYRTVLPSLTSAIDRFTGDEIVPKFELLKANVVGKLNGLAEYKKALNYVALSYVNSEEGKKAEKLLTINIPKLEALQLTTEPSTNWKILYKAISLEDKNTKNLQDKIKKFIADRSLGKLTTSFDIYTMTDNFVVIHGINSKDLAEEITSILKDYKDYQIKDTPIIISSENYLVVQIKKNIDDYLAGKFVDNAPKPNWDGTFERPIVPQPKVAITIPITQNNPTEQPGQDNPMGNNKGNQSEQGGQNKNSDLPPSPTGEQDQPKKR